METKTVTSLRALMADRYKSNSKRLKSYVKGLSPDSLWSGNMNFGKWSKQGAEGNNYLHVIGSFIDQEFLPADLSGKRVLDVGAGTGQSSLLLAAMGAKVAALEEIKERVEVASQLAEFFKVDIPCGAFSLYTPPSVFGEFDYVLFSGGLHRVSDPIVALRILYNNLVEHTGVLLVESACNMQSGRTCTYSVPTRVFGSPTYSRETCNWFIPSVSAAKQMCLQVGFATATAWKTESDRVMLACKKDKQVDMPRVGLSRGDLR